MEEAEDSLNGNTLKCRKPGCRNSAVKFCTESREVIYCSTRCQEKHKKVIEKCMRTMQEIGNLWDQRRNTRSKFSTEKRSKCSTLLRDDSQSTTTGATTGSRERTSTTSSTEPPQAPEIKTVDPEASCLSSSRQEDEVLQIAEDVTTRQSVPSCNLPNANSRREAGKTIAKPGALIEELVAASVNLSEVTLLVAVVEASQEQGVSTLIRKDGYEFLNLCSGYVLVILRCRGISAVVSAAELARKMEDVSEWINLDDCIRRNANELAQQTGSDKTLRKKKKKNGENEPAILDEIQRAALEEELCRDDEQFKKKSNVNQKKVKR